MIEPESTLDKYVRSPAFVVLYANLVAWIIFILFVRPQSEFFCLSVFLGIMLIGAVAGSETIRHKFLTPPLRIHPPLPEEFESHKLKHDDKFICDWHLFDSGETAPLVISVHGWGSSTARNAHRTEFFREQGWHVLSVDLRGHGRSANTCRWTAIQMAFDIAEIYEKIEDHIPRDRISSTIVHGYSIGAFITLRLVGNKAPLLKPSADLVIIEAPMTSLNLVFQEDIPLPLKFCRPIAQYELLWQINRWFPEFDFEWGDVSIPQWGVPNVPTLVIQGGQDARLGMDHYNLLMDLHLQNVEGRVLPGRTHRIRGDDPKRVIFLSEFLRQNGL